MPNVVRSSTMSKTSPKRVIAMPTEAENRKIRRAAKADPDAQPLTAEQLKAMVPIKAVRGRPKSENKKLLVSVRYSPRSPELLPQHRRRLAIAHGRGASRVCGQAGHSSHKARCLTPRSSGAPTAWRLARAAVLYIIYRAGHAPHRRCPLNSHVRPRYPARASVHPKSSGSWQQHMHFVLPFGLPSPRS
jgi:hypothetical protein